MLNPNIDSDRWMAEEEEKYLNAPFEDFSENHDDFDDYCDMYEAEEE